MRLAIICSHPIQYQAPVFAGLAKKDELDIRVFYEWQGTGQSVDPGFGQPVSWDIPLFDGYEHEFVPNIAADPGTHHFAGINCPKLIERVRDWKADAILIYGWCFKSHLAAMRYFKGRIPIYFRGDSTLLDENRNLKTVLRRIVLRWVYQHIDVAFSVGTNNRQYLRRHGVDEAHIVHAPHAIDNDRFSTVCREPSRTLRSELGIPESHIVFMFSGKLESKKAPDLVLQAFQQLTQSNVHLIFCGSGPLEKKLLAKRVRHTHFIGFRNQSQMPETYEAADLVMLPSRGPGETWGLALNEAMACGRAVLAGHKVGAAVDLIQPGENGWIVESGDAMSLAEAMNNAATMGRDKLADFGSRSQEIIANWSIERQVDTITSTLLAHHHHAPESPIRLSA